MGDRGTPDQLGTTAPPLSGDLSHLRDSSGSIIVLVGHAASGRTQAIRELEEFGYAGVDNFPPELLKQFVDLRSTQAKASNVAIALDCGDERSVRVATEALSQLEATDTSLALFAVECGDAVALDRFMGMEIGLEHSAAELKALVSAQKQALAGLRDRADTVLDTSYLSIYELRERLGMILSGAAVTRHVAVVVQSFGFKYGPLRSADLQFDVRFLQNPYYVAELRDLTGLDAACREYVFRQPSAQVFVETIAGLLIRLIPDYASLGRARLTVGIGCTGGQHRSVAIATALGEALKQRDVVVAIRHRQLEGRTIKAVS